MVKRALAVGGTVLLLMASLAVRPIVAAEAAQATGMKLEPRDGKAITDKTPVTFGMVFRAGEVAKGKTVTAKLGGADIAVQLDVKRRFEDGSVKHGVVSLIVPKLDVAAEVKFEPADPVAADAAAVGEASKKLLAGDFDAVVSFTFPERKPVTASARKMLEAAGAKAVTWLNGPVAVEWLLSGAPADADGKPDPDLTVQFQVRYYPATGQTRVSAVVEKCSDGGSDNGLIYDVVMIKGQAKPEVVFEQKDVHQPDLTRWRKVFWMGQQPAEVVVRHDARAMAAAGVIPQYDFNVQIQASTIDKQYGAWQKAKRGLFENGFINPDMPRVGGRPDIGPLTGWAALYLYTMDPRQREIVLGNDDLSGGIPIHGRSKATGRIPSNEERPKLWFDRRAGGGGNENFRPHPAAPRVAEPVKSIFHPESAHHPCLAYVSYLVTGDAFYLDEAYFWAGWLVHNSWQPDISKGTLCDGQLRGQSWSMRTVALVAAIAPDGDPEKVHLSAEVNRSIKRYLADMDAPDAWPLNTIRTCGDSSGDQTYPPWQHDYMIMAIDLAANAGFKEAERLRTRLLDFSIGRFTNAPDFDPHKGTGYYWTLTKVKTWKDLASAPGVDSPHWEDYTGGYCGLAMATASIGMRTGHPKAKEAYDWLVANTKNVLPGQPTNPCFAYSRVPVK